MSLGLREVAVALGGVVTGSQVSAPGPFHSPSDRSLVVRLSPTAPDGFLVHSHAGDDWRDCRDYVSERLGIPFVPQRRRDPDAVERTRKVRLRAAADIELQSARRAARARSVWAEALNPRGTIVESYLASRSLDLPQEVADVALRFHPGVAWRDDESGALLHVPAMLAPLRDLHTNEIVGLHRTRLTAEGVKVGRKMSGAATGTAIKLDADEVVTTGLAIAEGIESGLAARQLGIRPLWAVGSAGAIGALPVLVGIESLTLCAETDKTGANAAAIKTCGTRWYRAGCAVDIADPGVGDFNDALVRSRLNG